MPGSKTASRVTTGSCTDRRGVRDDAENDGSSVLRRILSGSLTMDARLELESFDRKLRGSWMFAIASGTIILLVLEAFFEM